MLPYLARRIANYAVLLFIATSLAYLLASASLDPSALWNRQDPSLNWDAIHANLVKYNISHDLPVWDRYVTWLRNVVLHWDWGRTPKGELINTLIGTKILVSVRLVFLVPPSAWSGEWPWGPGPPRASTASPTARSP